MYQIDMKYSRFIFIGCILFAAAAQTALAADELTINGTASLTLDSNAEIIVTGGITGTGTIACTGAGVVYLSGVWGDMTFSPGSSTVYFNGTGQNVRLGSGTPYFYNINVSGTNAGTASGSNIIIAPNGSFSVSSGGVYTLNGGLIRFGNNAALNVDAGGVFTATGNASITTTTPGTDRFLFSVNGQIGLDGCFITSTNASGLNIQSGATINRIKDVKFYNHPGGATDRFISVAIASLNTDFRGCWFDTITAGYNIYATGSGSVIRLENYGSGPGGGEVKDYDNDANDDGLADSGGAVVMWLQRSVIDTESAGGIQGYPTIAFDLNTYAYYSTYVVSRDLTGVGTNDRVYVIDADGTMKYSYDLTQAYGDIVSAPWWYTEGTTHTLYFGTTGGYLFRLVDTGSALNLTASWPLSVCSEVTSAVISDGVNLYFGGVETGVNKIFNYEIASRNRMFGLNSARVTATPSWAINGATTYLFAASDFNVLASGADGAVKNNKTTLTSVTAMFLTNGVAVNDVVVISSGVQQGRYRVVSVDSETQVTTDRSFTPAESALTFSIGRTLLYRVNVTTGLIDKENKTAFNHIRAQTVYWEWGSDIGIYAGDCYGYMQGVSPFSANFDNLTGFPVTHPLGQASAGTITSMTMVMYLSPDTRILYGDTAGWFYVRNMDGTIYNPGASYPLQPDSVTPATPIESSPMPDFAGSIYIGNNNGKVFLINEATRSVTKTYSFGAGIKIGDIGYDADNGRFIVPTSSGRVYYIQ